MQDRDKPLILVVDDEKPVRDLISRALGAKYDVFHAEDGEKCLEFLTEMLPDTILMDVRMPNMDGLAVCRHIKSDETTKDIPIIFISGLDSTDERVAGYEAGADDYLVKPFEVKVLREKVNVSVANHEKVLELKQNSSFATEAAMQAMTTTGELGVVLEFYRSSFACKDYQGLAESLCQSLAGYWLNSMVQVSAPDGSKVEVDNSGVVRPLEASLLQKLRFKDRIIDFGARTIINYPHVSVLIKNMPLEDEAKYGRFKDNLALLIEGASVRVENIIASNIIGKQKRALEGLLDKIKLALHEIQETHQGHKAVSRTTVESLVAHMEAAFLSAGLTEEQEVSFISLIEQSGDELISLYESGLSIDEKFSDIFSEIESGIPAQNIS